MKTFALVCLIAAAGCAPANYAYSFDLTDPGAKNLTKPGERDVLEDGDVKSEILVDPTSFQAVLLDLTNKTEVPLQINWDQIWIVGPDHSQSQLKPDAAVPQVEPNARITARLIPFSLPAVGAAAKAYDETDFELAVPIVVRGAPREMRYHLHAKVHKL